MSLIFLLVPLLQHSLLNVDAQLTNLIASLPDSSFTASSSHPDCPPSYARITSPRAWCAYNNNDPNDWLMIDLLRQHDISMVAIWPRKDVSSQYVTSYKLSYSSDGTQWTEKINPYFDTEFRDGGKGTRFNPPLGAVRFLKFVPLQQHEWKSMRVTAYESYYTPHGLKPLIQSLPDSAFTSSSHHSDCPNSNAKRASARAWCAGDTSGDQWIQVDLGSEQAIGSVSVWPRADDVKFQYVKKYKLAYSTDGNGWQSYADDGDGDNRDILNGPQSDGTGSDSADEVRDTLDYDITARYLRFIPLEWNHWPSMRIEAYKPWWASAKTVHSDFDGGDGNDGNKTFTFDISRSTLAVFVGLLLLFLVSNGVFCYMHWNRNNSHGYSAVRWVETETENDSEIPLKS